MNFVLKLTVFQHKYQISQVFLRLFMLTADVDMNVDSMVSFEHIRIVIVYSGALISY